MKTTSRLILAGIIAVLLTALSVLLWSETNINVVARDMVADDLHLQIDLPSQEPQAQIYEAGINTTYLVGDSPCSYNHIEDALVAAVNGDTILLQGGKTFNERFLSIYITQNLTIEGGQAICGSTSTAATTINADGAGFVIEASSSTATLKNLILTGGDNLSDGGGLRVVNSSTVTLVNTEIRANNAQNGAGLFVDGNSTVNFNGQIINNQASIHGGGLYIAAGTVNIYDSMIEGNSSEENGGAAFVSGGNLNLTGPLTLQSNSADNGGAIYAESSSTLDFEGVVFGSELGGNQATTGDGGAVYLDNSTMTAQNTNFVNNQATKHGGAIYAYNSNLEIYASFGTAILTPTIAKHFENLDSSLIQTTGCNPFLRECSAFVGNLANSDSDTYGFGGAIYLDGGSNLTMMQTYLHDNSAINGGAIYQKGNSTLSSISNCLIHHNTATVPSGAGITKFEGEFYLSSVTITDNSGGAGFLGQATSVNNSIAWESPDQGFSVTPSNYSCNIDSSSNAGIPEDPQFVNPGAGRDYHLQKTGPAVDACEFGTWQDLENRQRPIGAGYDMGAYELEITINLPLILR